jgi:putative FmdB family regulatory protein
MPIYEYECESCGTFEVSQRITEKALGKCPTCKGKVKKLISNTSFQLKGTGWYITDYARKGGANGDSSKTTASESQTKRDSKGDSPASKSDKTASSPSTSSGTS